LVEQGAERTGELLEDLRAERRRVRVRVRGGLVQLAEERGVEGHLQRLLCDAADALMTAYVCRRTGIPDAERVREPGGRGGALDAQLVRNARELVQRVLARVSIRFGRIQAQRARTTSPKRRTTARRRSSALTGAGGYWFCSHFSSARPPPSAATSGARVCARTTLVAAATALTAVAVVAHFGDAGSVDAGK
jgi:hypothetical protein